MKNIWPLMLLFVVAASVTQSSASIPDLSLVPPSAVGPPPETDPGPVSEHIRITGALCDQQLAVRYLSIAVAKPGVYVLRWDNADICTRTTK